MYGPDTAWKNQRWSLCLTFLGQNSTRAYRRNGVDKDAYRVEVAAVAKKCEIPFLPRSLSIEHPCPVIDISNLHFFLLISSSGGFFSALQ
jgi:hypothetical protein